MAQSRFVEGVAARDIAPMSDSEPNRARRQRYLRYADDAFEEAERATDPMARLILLKAAESWRILAELSLKIEKPRQD